MTTSLDSGIQLSQSDSNFRLKFPSDTTFLSPARLWVTRWLVFIGAPAEGWDLIITELLSNAVNAAPPASELIVEVEIDRVEIERAETDNKRIRCEVLNVGTWEHPKLENKAEADLVTLAKTLPAAAGDSSDRGRGLALISELTDGTVASHDSKRTSVVVWRTY